ncbi:MAG: AMP-binding protein [Nitrospinae bacterium]|nr:AMP-binding protein [Nitrospinota bacterium]
MDTLIDILNETTAKFPDSIFLDGDVEGRGRVALTRKELCGKAAVLARELMDAGVKPGDFVAQLAPNQPEWGVGYFGALLAGGVLVPLDVNLKEGELANILEKAGPVCLVTDTQEEERSRRLADGLASACPVLRIDEDREPEPGVSLDTLPGAERGPDDLALVSFSSGTTGTPKGVMLSHGNITSNVSAVLQTFLAGEDDVFLSVLPLHHMFESTGGFLIPLGAGARVHYLSSLNPRLLVEAMQNEGITICLMVPALARLIHKRIMSNVESLSGAKKLVFKTLFGISGICLSIGLRVGGLLFSQVKKNLGPDLRFFASGGAALDPKITRDLLILGIEVLQGYGLTETSPVTHATPPGAQNRIGTVGPPIPGVEARIVPVEGADEGEGEILIRGPNVMQGYFENPELTAEVLRDGWFHTGDIGRLDTDGYLTICGRSKNVIVSEAGKNIYPEEVEEQLLESEWFQDVCVIGRKTPRGGEEVFAVVVLDPESDLPQEDEMRTSLADSELKRLSAHLADYKRVAGFFVWPEEELPRTTTRKHKREDIKEILRERPEFSPDDF